MTGGGEASRAALWAARLLALLAVLLAAVAVVLPLVSGLGYLDDLMGTPEVVVAVSFSLVGALLVHSDQAARIGWLLLAIGVSAGLYTASVSYTAFVLRGDVDAPLPAGADLALVTAWIGTWAWFPAWLLVSTVLPQVIPYGRPLSPRWRVPVALACVFCVIGVLDFATAPGQVGFFTQIDNPVSVAGLSRILDPVGRVLDIGVLVLIALAVVSVVVRVVRADGTERRQVGWFGYSLAMAVVVIVAVPSVWINLVVLLIPAGLAVAALRYRLYDLDLLVNRTVVAGALVGLAALAYVALVAWVGSLAGTSDGVTPFVAALAVALAFNPARVRVQRGVDRLFFGRRGDPLALLHELDRSLREAGSPQAALRGAARVVRTGLRLPGAAVVVPLPSGEEVRAQDGTVPADAAALPLDLHGEQVGTLLVAPRKAGEPVRGTDLRVLTSLTGPLASAAYALRLTGDLEDSRRRLLEAREEERRRLRRDLHDGLGPQLAGVVMGLDVVGSALARGDTVRAAELACTATHQAREAVEDVRRLAHGLRPPVLDDLGLVGALQSTGPAAAPGGPSVHVLADGGFTDLPAAVEVAAYRIAQEGVTNAVRHARASRVEVRLRSRDDALTVEVHDDGAGLPDDVRAGVGLTSMRERAAEVGGWCTVAAHAGGTLVTARLPRRTA